MRRIMLVVAMVLSGCATEGPRWSPAYSEPEPTPEPPQEDPAVASCRATLTELARGPVDDSPEATQTFMAKVAVYRAREHACDALMADAQAAQGRWMAEQDAQARATDRRLSREMAEHDRRAANVTAVGAALQTAGQGLQQAGQPAGRPPLRCTPDPLAVVPGSMTCR